MFFLRFMSRYRTHESKRKATLTGGESPDRMAFLNYLHASDWRNLMRVFVGMNIEHYVYFGQKYNNFTERGNI